MTKAFVGLRKLEVALILGLVALTVAFVASMFTTSDRWVRLTSLTVFDAQAGQVPRITYDREFIRDFPGHWLVEVWRINRGQPEAGCPQDGEWNYRKAKPSQDQDLLWLLGDDDKCLPKEPGFYFVAVHLTVNPGTILARTATIQSNIFEVR